MADVAPMALRTLPIAGESLLGFLLRLAERSSVRDPIAFLSELGNPSTTLDALAFRPGDLARFAKRVRSEEHTSELQSLMRTSYAVFCLKKKKKNKTTTRQHDTTT